ncbi:MAG: MptD family putative ECF transporter S component [Lachnospiraceae bacterium]|nr:MptD family putative ECF transporter S component [Lachnospiraceae bacterium]
MENTRKTKSSRGAISAGVFIALYLVTYFIVGAITMPVAVLFVLMPEAVALLAAPTYHMMLTKSPSWISILIAAFLPSLLLIASGHIPIAPLVAIPAGIVAALIAGKGNYKSFRWNSVSHMFFSLNLFGGFIPIWVMRDYFFQDTFERGMSQEFCDALRALTPWWVLPVIIIATMLCSLLGSVFTQKVLSKHLEKAGVL